MKQRRDKQSRLQRHLSEKHRISLISSYMFAVRVNRSDANEKKEKSEKGFVLQQFQQHKMQQRLFGWTVLMLQADHPTGRKLLDVKYGTTRCRRIIQLAYKYWTKSIIYLVGKCISYFQSRFLSVLFGNIYPTPDAAANILKTFIDV